MAPISVKINHAGKVYEGVDLDPHLPASSFKSNIFKLTGVPVDRMKVIVKGGVLKDDTSWQKVVPKDGQTFMVIGTASELPKPPEKPVVFLEDLNDEELAEVLTIPVGLRNLGNTCYMNASVQALRAIPELQVALSVPELQSDTPLPRSLRELYASMSHSSHSVDPTPFLTVLRQVNPRFAEVDRREKAINLAGYAQQDAEECFGEIINTLRNIPGLSPEVSESQQTETHRKRFIQQYLTGIMRRELICDEAPAEAPSISQEPFTKIQCHINSATNYMFQGIMNSLDEKIEKRSDTLGRDAVYTQKTRVTRLPAYLIVHMVRFAWKQDIGKKAKIMRKVKFPLEFDALDALDLVTDELKVKLLPVGRRLKEIEGERAERRKVRKRTKTVPSASGSSHQAVAPAPPTIVTNVDVEMGDTAAILPADEPGALAEAKREKEKERVAGGELEDESVYRAREKVELEALIHEEVKNDTGASTSGLYDLVSIVTHKGPAADSGHYMGFTKKSVFHSVRLSPEGTTTTPAAAGMIDEDDEDWYKFDDDKVSIFPKSKLSTLDGGGEDSSAYVLVYKSKPI